jgi:hypothetical protein
LQILTYKCLGPYVNVPSGKENILLRVGGIKVDRMMTVIFGVHPIFSIDLVNIDIEVLEFNIA